MARTIKQFWDEMKVELDIEDSWLTYERVCKIWRSRAFSSESKLATAVEALKRITEITEQEEYFDCEECISMMEDAAKQALEEIGVEHE